MRYTIKYDNKVVGVVKNNKFYTKRDRNSVFFKFKSFNVSQNVIDQLKDIDVNNIVIQYQETPDHVIEYERTIEEIENYNTYDLGTDRQRVIPIEHLKNGIRNYPKPKAKTLDDWNFDDSKKKEVV